MILIRTFMLALLVLAGVGVVFAQSKQAGMQQQGQDDTSDPQVGSGRALSGTVEAAGAANEPTPLGNLLQSGSTETKAASVAAMSYGISKGGARTVTAATNSGLVINATFDSSITNSPNSAAIQAMINQAIAIYQSIFTDPITVSILFRYSTTAPDGSPLSSGLIARSNYVVYSFSWNTYINALIADAKTTNDTTANASLPASALSTNIRLSSANGRAVGLNTPPAMFADGSVGGGGPYDGIVTLNSAQPLQFTRPPSSGNYDALRSTEHEMDEILGLGSFLDTTSSNLKPQDLFSWSAPGTRNTTSSGSRYFSIDSGNTNIVNFNQNSSGDFGDWLSAPCLQANPYVQNAFSCRGQFSDVTPTSPEGINLDVIGYDQVSCAFSISPDSQSFTASAGTGSVNVTTTSGCAWSAVSNSSFIITTSGASGNSNGIVSYTVAANTGPARTGSLSVAGQTFTVNQAGVQQTVQLSASSYSVNKHSSTGQSFATITVTRTGDLSAPATVKYATSDSTDVNFKCDPNTPGQPKGVASRKCDYHITVGRLRFAAGESTKQIVISIVDNIYVKGQLLFTLTLSNPAGANLGTPNTATITILDNGVVGGPNPIDGTSFFVRQLYVDLLSREPDPPGWAGWIHRIDFCGQPGEPPPPCDRVTVGGDGFLRSSEFFDRQFFVLRLYRTGLGRIPLYDEVGDLAYVSGFLTSGDLELNKQELVSDLMSRTEFSTKYNALSNLSFVDTLLQTAGVTVPPATHDGWIAALNNSSKTRAQIYREISERQEVSDKYLHEAQVISAYYGFFTRNPDGAYFDFLRRLDSGEINQADLANAFINALEYRQRFAP